MDEKYIQDLYNHLGGQSKFGKYEDFRDLISSDETYRKQFHQSFGDKQLGAYQDFDVLVKKKEQSLPVSKEPSVGGLVVDGTTPKTRAGSIDFEASSLEAGNDLSKSNAEAGKEIPLAKNSLELVGEINDLSKVGTVHVSGGTGGAAAGFSQSPDAYKKSQENYTKLKGSGLKDKDIAEIKNDLSDLSPEVQGLSVTDKDGKVSYPYSLKSLGELRDVDPIAYKTKLNAVKTYDVIRRTAGTEKANEFSRLQNQNQAQLNQYTDIEDFNRKKEKQKEIIRATLKGDDRDIAMQRVDENSEIILNDAIPDSKSAEDYLNNRLYQSKGTLSKKLTLHDALMDSQDAEFTGNVNDFKLESIQSKLDPNNPADEIAFAKYKRGVNLNNALSHSVNLDEAALNFASSEDDHLAATIKTLNAGGQELPNSYKGEIVANFLNDPEIIAKAQGDPEFAKEYTKTAQNLYFNYPDFAKTEIGNIISQAREDEGYNNWFANVPTKNSTDKLVDKLVADGKMTELQKNIYLRDIAPELGVGKSIKRGFGHILAPAFTDNSPIATPDLLTHAGEGWDNTMGGLYKSLKLLSKVVPTGGVVVLNPENKGETAFNLLEALKNEKENTAIQPKGLLHKAAAASGDFIPLVVSMAVGGGVLKGAGKAGEAINMALQFAGNNAEKALVAFPDSPLKQKMYTGAATSIDMFLGRLLPHNKALSQEVSNSIRKDITGVISDFASEKITADAAKKTILNRIEDLVTKKAPEILKANTETGAIIAAFSAGHNGLDIAFGAKPPQSVEDFAKETAQAFETGFLGNTLVAAAMAGKNTATVKDNLLKASANPEHYIEQIKIAAAKNPEIAKQQEELINNVNVAVEARKVADAKGMNEKQTEDFILLHVAQGIQENKAKNATVDVAKDEATAQAKDLKARKEKVYGGEVDTKLSELIPDDFAGGKIDEQGVPVGKDVPQPTVSETEGKKAEIEKNRQDEIQSGNTNARLIHDTESGQPLTGADENMANKMIDKTISKAKNTDDVHSFMTQLGWNLRGKNIDDFNQFVQDRIDGKTDKTFEQWRNENSDRINEINEKYDAELAALETEGKSDVVVDETLKDFEKKINEIGNDFGFDKPQRKDYEEGGKGDLDYANDTKKHNDNIDAAILGLTHEGTLKDSQGNEYLVTITTQGVRVVDKLPDGAEGTNIYYRKGKRTMQQVPFSKGFTFKIKYNGKDNTTNAKSTTGTGNGGTVSITKENKEGTGGRSSIQKTETGEQIWERRDIASTKEEVINGETVTTHYDKDGKPVMGSIKAQSLSKQESGVTPKPETKPVKNEEAQAPKILDTKEKEGIADEGTGQAGKEAEAGGGKEGKYEAKARKLAEKIMASETPDWLKIDDPNVSKKGAGAEEIKKALADATIKMGKLLDKGVEFSEAVKESVKDLVNMLGEGARTKIEEGFAKDYEGKLNDLSGIKKGLVSDKIIEGVDLERVGDKEMMALGRKILDTGEVKPEALVTKIITDGKGVLTPTEVVGLITYKRDIDNAVQDVYKQINERVANGEDIGTLGVEAKNLERQINNFDVMAVITAQQQSMAFRLRQRMLDKEYNVVTQIEKYKANNGGEIPADVEARFREVDKELKEVKAKLVEAEKKAAQKEGQDAVDNIKESVGREKKYTEEELQAELKKERASLRVEKKEKVHKAIDDMMDKWAKKISPEHLRGTDTKGVNADKVFKSVGAIMKKAYDAGELTTKIVEDAVKYISEKLGNKDWGIEEFKNENWDEKLRATSEKKAKDKPTINEDGTVSIPNQMLRDLVKRGVTDIEGLTKEVHEQVKKDLPDVTERQVRDYITDYGKKVNPTADVLQTQVNTAKRVGRLLSELEDLKTMGKIEFLAKYRKPKPSESKITERENQLRQQIKSLGNDILGDIKGGKESDTKHQSRIEYLEKELNRVRERRRKDPKEKKESTREIPEDERLLLEQIEAEQTKWDSEKDAARQRDNDYGKMETERNRQLKRVEEINEKIDILKSGKLPETKSVEAKKDTPEIEALKAEKEALEKSVRQSIAHEKKMTDLETELQRLKDRKEKEPKPDSKRVISREESLKRDEIEAERKAWAVEKNINKLKTDLQRVRDRQKKVTNPKDRRELTDTEKDLVKQIKAEQEVWNKEVEPERKVREALKAADKSLAEYERRIAEKDFSKKDTNTTPETPELKALREKRDAKRKEYEKLKKATLPKIEKTEAERLKAAKELAKRKIDELTTKIKNKDFAKPVKKPPVTDTELQTLKAKQESLKEEYDKEQYKLELKNRPFWVKVEDGAKEATNGLLRGLIASLDFSAPLVQGTVRLFTDLGKSTYEIARFKKLSPNRSINAIGTMFKHFFSEKAADNYMTKLKVSEAYPFLKASGLAIGDKSGRISVKEGMFISNWIKQIWNYTVAPVLTVPISVGTKFNVKKAYNIAKAIDPYVASQRAFDGYLTSVRVNSMLDISKYIERRGYKFETDTKEFQKAADFINTTTMRGSLGKAEQAASWMDIFLFAPRKVIAEVKMFTPYAFVYYSKMPKVVRQKAIKDLGAFLGTFITANALLWAATKKDDDEEDNFWNANSTDFLTHKIGDKRYGVGGGIKSILVFQSRFWSAKFVDQYGTDAKLGERYGKEINTRFDLLESYVIGKSSPALNIAIQKMKERAGIELETTDVLQKATMPMWAQDLKEMYKEDPATVNAILTGLSLFGMNLRVVGEKKTGWGTEDKENPIYKPFIDAKVELPKTNPKSIEVDFKEGKAINLSDKPQDIQDKYISTKDKYVREMLKDLYKGDTEVYVDEDGRISIPLTNEDKQGKDAVLFKKLTPDQLKEAVSLIGGSATTKTKDEMFPKD